MRAILTYHSVDPSGSPISVDEASFRSHVAWLASGVVRVMPLPALAGTGGDGPAVALTFDDAFRNFADVAWPLLRDRRLPVTLFVVTGRAGSTNAWNGKDAPGIPTLPLMDWDALGRVAAEGVTLGAHSRTHPDLRGADDARMRDELAGSADDIAARTGRRPEAVAYPYGGVDDRVAAAAETSFRIGCTTELRELQPDDPMLRLPRLDAFYLRAGSRLASFGSPAFRRYVRWRAGLRRVRAALTGRPA